MGLFAELQGKTLFLVGIKGSGMSSLASLLASAGIRVTGSDIPDHFATETVLRAAGIDWVEDFGSATLPKEIDILIYSAAYDPDFHEQIACARKCGVPVYSYPQWLSRMSRQMHAYGVAGTHGKTTSTGCVDWLLRHTGIPYFALYGARIQHESRSTFGTGDSFGVFEACEYRDHFLSYQLDGLLVTTIEHDHPDWFLHEGQVLESFKALVSHLPPGAPVVCGMDSSASRELVSWISATLPRLHVLTFGTHPDSMFRLEDHQDSADESSFRLSPWRTLFHTRLASPSLCLDIIGAALLGSAIIYASEGSEFGLDTLMKGPVVPALLAESASFPGCAGRVELLFEEDGVAYVDDYAHHPKEISTSLEHLGARFPDRRIVTIFFPHTRSRTEAFYTRFVESLSRSNLLVVRPIFASARADGTSDEDALAIRLARDAGGLFIGEEQELIRHVADMLRQDDVCVTMGAGNNSGLAQRIAARRRSDLC